MKDSRLSQSKPFVWPAKLPSLQDIAEPRLKQSLRFFREQHIKRSNEDTSTVRLVMELENFLVECHKFGDFGSDCANRLFTNWLNAYMKASGLRVACISKNCDGAPSFLRYVRSGDERKESVFRTEHKTPTPNGAKTRQHGRRIQGTQVGDPEGNTFKAKRGDLQKFMQYLMTSSGTDHPDQWTKSVT